VIQDLPEKQETKVYCNLTEEQATLYESVVQKVMEKLAEAEGIERKGLVLSMLMQLKQVCNHPAQFLHQVGNGYTVDLDVEKPRSGKLTRLTEMLEEAVSVRDRVLIFTQFAEMGHLLKEHCRVWGICFYTVPAQTEVMVKRFQEEDNGPPFLLSLGAGGTGLG
jgi:SNF2 family DNA or RNA helicase